MALSDQDKKEIHALLNRPPSEVELSIFDAMWSEHCSYKSTKRLLKLLPTEAEQVALGIGEDSGIVHLTEHEGKKYCLAVSHESHNHPSQILPIEGAATGVGGVVRDVYCMGADVIGVLNSLHFGIDEKGDNPMVDEIAKGVVQGVADYANPLGVPVLGGETLFHTSYNQNCLVNVAAVGLLTEDEIIHSYVPDRAKTEPYVLILFGKSTDSTGFGGASFSSATLSKDDELTNMGAVQVHDPFLKRMLVVALKALFQYVKDEKIEIGMKDLGAGGISCAASEIAAANDMGVVINIEDVNVVSDHLPPEVIACSETQERFCVAVPKDHAQAIMDIFNKDFDFPGIYPGAGAVVIGDVVNDQVFKLLYKGDVVCELPIGIITTDVSVYRDIAPKDVSKTPAEVASFSGDDLIRMGLDLLKNNNGLSKRFVYRYFDNAVRGDAIIYPGEADAVVTAPISGSKVGVAVSMDSNLYGHADPYVAGAAAVAESIRNVVSVGAEPLAITDCLNYGSPERPDSFWDFEQGVIGIKDACEQLSFSDSEPLPVISGNVSLYNEACTGTSIIPSPVILTMGRVNDYTLSRTAQCQESGLNLYLVGQRHPEFAGTAVASFLDNVGCAPQVRFEEERAQNKVIHGLFQDQKVAACHDISSGGLWQAVIEMSMGERGLFDVGIQLDLPENDNAFVTLFSENGGYVVACQSEHSQDIENRFQEASLTFSKIGKTISDSQIRCAQGDTALFSVDLEACLENWNTENKLQMA